MYKVINNVFYNVDTPKGRAAYTDAALKYRRAQRQKKRENEAIATIMYLVEKSSCKKGRQR